MLTYMQKRYFFILAMPHLLLVLLFLFTLPGHAQSPDLVPLKSAAPGELGPLSLPNVSLTPLGSAHVYGSAFPDIFLVGRGGLAGVHLARWLRNSLEGAPIFAAPVPIQSPFKERGTLLQTADGKIHAVWFEDGHLINTVFDLDKLAFTEVDRLKSTDLPKSPQSLALIPNPDGSLNLIFEIADDTVGKKGDNRTAEWRAYDAAGIWTGGFPYRYLYSARLPALLNGPLTEIKQVSPTRTYMLMGQLAPVNLGPGHERDLISGSRQGIFTLFSNTSATSFAAGKGILLANSEGNALRSPNISVTPIAYPAPLRGLSSLLAGGEGNLNYYQFTGTFTSTGHPVFRDPVPALQENADLFTGSLPSPSVIDWDGDGVEDIICGNSEGNAVFFRNVGTQAEPKFLPGVRLQAGDHDIQVQAGYSGSVQGVQEARWGYTSPTAFDWNNDGLPDLIMGDITGNYTVYMNRGTKTAPKLDAAQPIYCDGLDLHGMWRCAAAAARIGDRNALIIVDGDDNFHLYWQIDEHNVEDGGKLKLADGSLITASGGEGGTTGRAKLSLFDWDQDGLLDLIIGTARSNSIPNRQTGYPFAAYGPKAPSTALFMKNVGTNKAPIYEHALPFIHAEKGPVQMGGAHESGAVATTLGGNGPNLLVGNETGRLFLLNRENLSLAKKP